METKYYTPVFEDFYVGFEYESNYLKEEWSKITLQPEDAGYFFEQYITDASPYEFRVKYLDRDDIESLGWNQIGHDTFSLSGDIENYEL